MIDTINEILFWICLVVLLWNGYVLLVNKSVPNFRTRPAIREKMVAFMQEDRAARGEEPYTIVDMGAGNGHLSRYIARKMPEARVIGIERSPVAYLVACTLKRLWGVRNLEYVRGDMYEYDLRGAGAVVMYLTAYEMDRIARKFAEELRPGTPVLSNRFFLPEPWTPLETIDFKGISWHGERLNIYRV